MSPAAAPLRLLRPSLARSRAASRAQSEALDAVSWMTPPPAEVDLNRGGRASISTSQSMTWVSSSVQAGLGTHIIPCTPRPGASRPPGTGRGAPLPGKEAGEDGVALDVLQVLGDPVDDHVAVAAELFGCHGALL